MFACALPAWAADLNVGDTFTKGKNTYKVTSSTEVSLTKNANVSGILSLTIPDNVEDANGKSYKVTAIGDEAFSGCTAMTSLTIGTNVSNIGAYAFYNCQKLQSLTIPANVKNIESYAFTNCYKLETLTFENNSALTTIGEKAFDYCRLLESLELPNSLVTVGTRAFRYCDVLTNITFGDNINTINQAAFYGCLKLKTISFGKKIPTVINTNAFYNNILQTVAVHTPTISTTALSNNVFFGTTSPTLVVYAEDKTNFVNAKRSNDSEAKQWGDYFSTIYLAPKLNAIIAEGCTVSNLPETDAEGYIDYRLLDSNAQITIPSGASAWSNYAALPITSGKCNLTIQEGANDLTVLMGNGTLANPFLIGQPEVLKWFADFYNSHCLASTDAERAIRKNSNVKLTKDIDLSSICHPASAGQEEVSWVPIGTNDNGIGYSQTFDGNNKTISGLYINRTGAKAQALFSFFNYATIKNLTVSGSVTSNSDYTAGLCGRSSSAKITNCHNMCTVQGTRFVGGICGYESHAYAGTRTTFNGCSNTGSITGSRDYIGGICGYAQEQMTGNYNEGTITGGNYVGGIVGNIYEQNEYISYIDKCYNTGNVTSSGQYVGGITGWAQKGTAASLSISNCYNTGAVKNNSTNSGYYAGGICGYVGDAGVEISNCFNTGSITGGNSRGQIRGIEQGIMTNCYSNSSTSAKNGTQKTNFATGEVAYLLDVYHDGTWGQKLGTDALPNLGCNQVYYKPSATFSMSKTYGTFCYNWNVILPEGITAYKEVHMNSNLQIFGTPIEDGIIPAATPVVLMKDPSITTYINIQAPGGYSNSDYHPFTDEATCISGQLVGFLNATPDMDFEIPYGEAFGLTTINGVQAFYVMNMSSTKGTNHRCYLDTTIEYVAPSDMSANSVRLFGPEMEEEIEGSSTDIKAVETICSSDAATFDMHGNRVEQMQKGRIYIINGNKVIRK